VRLEKNCLITDKWSIFFWGQLEKCDILLQGVGASPWRKMPQRNNQATRRDTRQSGGIEFSSDYCEEIAFSVPLLPPHRKAGDRGGSEGDRVRSGLSGAESPVFLRRVMIRIRFFNPSAPAPPEGRG
jgi:hypothetical protein